jgi:hypothetical protein
MQPMAGFTGRELMLSVLPPTLPWIVRLPGRRESGTLSRRSAGRNAKLSDQPPSSAAPVEAYFDALGSPSAGLRDEAEAKQRDHENRTETRAEPEDAMGRAAEEMATSSLHFLDGVPRCPS